MNRVVPAKDLVAGFQKFIVGKRFLICDASGTVRGNLASLLSSLGAKAADMVLVSTIAAAEEEMKRVKPHIVITDYEVGKRSGLDLIAPLKAHHPNLKETLFVLVTGNTSQTAVAKAAEEDVDTFVLKPFTPDSFRTAVLKIVYTKIEPSEYTKVVEIGKDELAAGKFDEAIATFKKAKTLDPAPALACFYMGQASLMKQVADQAEGSFLTGLNYNKIHYKCLIGLYEVLMGQKRHLDAYNVIKRISHYFPANPQRLTAVLRLAILTKSYEDVERYYRMFTNIEARNDEMVKYICAALVVCGKYYLMSGSNSRALELFEKAAVTAAGRTRILREIITSLVDFDLEKQGAEFLKRFPPETHSSADYLVSRLLISEGVDGLGKVIEMARESLAKGAQDPVVYQVMIRSCTMANLKDAAEDAVAKASGRWPEQKQAFADLLAKARAEKAEDEADSASA